VLFRSRYQGQMILHTIYVSKKVVLLSSARRDKLLYEQGSVWFDMRSFEVWRARLRERMRNSTLYTDAAAAYVQAIEHHGILLCTLLNAYSHFYSILYTAYHEQRRLQHLEFSCMLVAPLRRSLHVQQSV
jgi:hypothetical protein